MNGVIHFEFFYFSDEIKSTQYIFSRHKPKQTERQDDVHMHTDAD